MRVLTTQVINVQRDLGVIAKALEKFVQEVDVELGYPRARELHTILETRSPGKIHYDSAQSFVEWDVRVSVAPYAALVTERFRHRLTKRNTNILDCMMRINVQITLGLYRQVDQPMACNLIQHVLEERQARFELGGARAIEINRYGNLGLFGAARYLSRSLNHCGTTFRVRRLHTITKPTRASRSSGGGAYAALATGGLQRI
jgi:hypothetical protein